MQEIERHGDKGATFAKLQQAADGPVDSYKVKRGICTYGVGKGKPSGDEIVVFSWDQVRVLREVPRDPVPPAA